MTRPDDTFWDAWAAVADVEGWLTEGQAQELFDAAHACPNGGRIVEIGSFRGRSTIVLALGAPDGVEVVAIDPHAGNDRGPQEIEGYEDAADEDRERFEANLSAAGVRERVRHVAAFSAEAQGEVEGGIDVLYVDGAHRYRPARADIRDWGARVVGGGTMLVHDSFSSIGVTCAIVRQLLLGRRFRYVGRSRSLAIYRVDRSIPWWRSVTGQLGQLPWFAKNVGVKVLISARILRHTEWPY